MITAILLGCPHSAPVPVATPAPEPLAAQLFGAPFDVQTALAMSSPSSPGTVAVLLAAGPLTCDGLEAHMRAAMERNAADVATVVVYVQVGDRPAPAGELEASYEALADRMAVAVGPAGMGMLRGSAHVVGPVHGAAGDVNTAALAYEGFAFPEAKNPVATVPTDRLAGTVPFTLCNAIVTERPSLAGTRFVPRDLHLVLPPALDLPAFEIDVRVAIPDGWKPLAGGLSETWVAPDGRTDFSVGLDYAESDLAALAERRRGPAPVGAADPPGTVVDRWRFGDDTVLDVYRQGEDWPVLVTCGLSGADHVAPEVFDAAEAACRALERIPAPRP
jgi:hypothetical protein